MTHDVIDITKKFIACPSVTPKDEGALIYLGELLEGLGFECHHLPFEDVPNLFARLGTKAPHICYAGHTDVVPAGDENRWTYPPFTPTIVEGKLYGRGASDMKGSVAAFVAAVSDYLEKTPDQLERGSISFLITGDEEGPALHGTVKVLDWMAENGHIPDVALVGEPTNPDFLGQELKIGRRGSLNGRLRAQGKQGHVAYQHLADNPLPRLAKMVDALASCEFDTGSEFFPPTNLEFTSIDVGNPAGNVIPDSGTADFNIRFNDLWDYERLEAKLHEVLKGALGDDYILETDRSAESFLTKPGEWPEIVRQAVVNVTGKTPEYTTNGGTSDARFVVKHCPVIEFGPVNESIHQIDENADVAVLQDLTKIYTEMLGLYFRVKAL